MNLEWILNPATQYAAMGLILIAVLGAAFSLKRELHVALTQAKEAREAASGCANSLAEQLQGLRLEMKQMEANALPPVPGESIDLGKRSRVLRMHHRGEELPTIAAALNTPLNEVELLLKIDQLLNATE
jgi:hypothetical protein